MSEWLKAREKSVCLLCVKRSAPPFIHQGDLMPKPDLLFWMRTATESVYAAACWYVKIDTTKCCHKEIDCLFSIATRHSGQWVIGAAQTLQQQTCPQGRKISLLCERERKERNERMEQNGAKSGWENEIKSKKCCPYYMVSRCYQRQTPRLPSRLY